jgi:very-short-patch-repair endonuclease
MPKRSGPMDQNLTEEIKYSRKLTEARLVSEIDEARVQEVFDIIVSGKLAEAAIPLTFCESPIEKIMFLCLWDQKAEGFSIIPQHPFEIGGKEYRADFFLRPYNEPTPRIKIIVECDGHDFHERTPAQAQHDKERDRNFVKNGHHVLRYTGREIYRDPFKCAVDAWQTIESLYGGVVECKAG